MVGGGRGGVQQLCDPTISWISCSGPPVAAPDPLTPDPVFCCLYVREKSKESESEMESNGIILNVAFFPPLKCACGSFALCNRNCRGCNQFMCTGEAAGSLQANGCLLHTYILGLTSKQAQPVKKILKCANEFVHFSQNVCEHAVWSEHQKVT